ncbi:MAG TPA: gamma-glutamyl-gamma-aminobutyrate hydrolase family protein [Pseudomonas sp.]|nr:gamma-glutamyl-gamma-aminobutyrate hydrolase family protein [Pseudomonas sp.]
MSKPLIGLSLCRWLLKDRDEGWFHLVGEKYVKVITGYDAFPLMVPALGDKLDIEPILQHCSGILFSGSVSNIHPSFYGEDHEGAGLADKPRDATVLRLMAAAIERGIPVLGICRGIQEMNVLYGGTLHRHVHEVPGRLDHREIPDVEDDVCYAPVHAVKLTEGGVLHGIHGVTELNVNSLHGQGIDRVGEGLLVEAVAPDGQVEAISVKGSKAFAVGVQWHPEYHPKENPDYDLFIRAFHTAVREYQQKKQG